MSSTTSSTASASTRLSNLPHTNFPGSVWFYNPSFALAVVATLLFVIPSLVLLHFTLWPQKQGSRHLYFICIVIGGALEVAGYVLRTISTKNQTSAGPYIISQVFVVIAPLFVAASLYMFLSRAIPASLSSQQTRIYGVSTRFLAKIFVGSDIVSLLMQAGGAAIASGKHVTDKKRNIGKDLLLAGLILQIATFSIFLLMVTGFTRRLPAEKTSRHEGLGKVILGIYVAGALIQVRSIYRLIEFAIGFNGYLYTHEWIFYVFESFPMLVALSVLCLSHPAKWLPGLKPSAGRTVGSPMNHVMETG